MAFMNERETRQAEHVLIEPACPGEIAHVQAGLLDAEQGQGSHAGKIARTYAVRSTTPMPNSFSWTSSMRLGASIITSRPALFFGKAMNSRISLRPPKSDTQRSKPNAAPPCGGAPYSKASMRKPNL